MDDRIRLWHVWELLGTLESLQVVSEDRIRAGSETKNLGTRLRSHLQFDFQLVSGFKICIFCSLARIPRAMSPSWGMWISSGSQIGIAVPLRSGVEAC